MISVHFQGKAINITVIQVDAPTINAEEAQVEWFDEDLQDPLELTPKTCHFYHRGPGHNGRKSRETCSSGQVWPGVQNEAGQSLTEFCQENALIVANTLFQQHKRQFYTRWTSPDGQHQNQIDYILCSQRWRGSIQSAKTRPGADCRTDHELLIAKFRLKLKKVGKTTNHSGMASIKSVTIIQWK